VVRRFGQTAVGLALIGLLSIGVPQAREAGMERFRWQNRVLLVFAPGPHDPVLRRQLGIAQRHAAGWRDRDMVTIVVGGARPVTVDGTPAKDLANDALRRRYDVSGHGFAAVLVGKDGTEKLRRDGPIPAATLFETIDAMPMRRREMRERDAGG
jgi:hypothetical protein